MKGKYTGLRAWLVQRASAVYMLFFILFFLVHLAFDPPRHYSAWHAWITSPAMSIAVCAFFAALLAHAWVGLHDVLTDYVHAISIRAPLLGLVGLGLVSMGVWVVRILWMPQG
jgi:succinate dehydrogenase / fumarate reductase membrane anchor subunit